MGLKLTCVDRSRLAISRNGNAVMPSQTSPSNKCDVIYQKTCGSAINLKIEWDWNLPVSTDLDLQFQGIEMLWCQVWHLLDINVL